MVTERFGYNRTSKCCLLIIDRLYINFTYYMNSMYRPAMLFGLNSFFTCLLNIHFASR